MVNLQARIDVRNQLEGAALPIHEPGLEKGPRSLPPE